MESERSSARYKDNKHKRASQRERTGCICVGGRRADYTPPRPLVSPRLVRILVQESLLHGARQQSSRIRHPLLEQHIAFFYRAGSTD